MKTFKLLFGSFILFVAASVRIGSLGSAVARRVHVRLIWTKYHMQVVTIYSVNKETEM